MAENKEEILIEIVVSNEAATKAIFESQQSIERLKTSQKDLNKQLEEGKITSEEYSKKTTAVKVAIDQQKEAIRLNEKELRNNIKSQKENNDSLAAMRAQLSNNVKEFDNLSKAERESAKGQELQNNISNLTAELKEAEEATGRFQRNVGNYPESMNKAVQPIQRVTGFLGKMGDQLNGLGQSKVGNVFNSLSNSIGGFASKASGAGEEIGTLTESLSGTSEAMNTVEGFAGKAGGGLTNFAGTAGQASTSIGSSFASIGRSAISLGMVFLTPPVIVITAIVLAIIAVIKLLSEGFKLNGDASDKMAESLAVLDPILDAVGKLAAYLAGIVADLVHFLAEGIANVIDFTAALFGLSSVLGSTAKESMALVKAQNELEDAEREFSVNTAKRALERSRIMAEVTDKDKNNAEKRIAFLKDALELEKLDLVEKKALAAENLRIIEATAKKQSDTSDETADKIAQAKIKQLDAEKEYFEGVKEINKKLIAAEDELAAERKAKFDEWEKMRDEQLTKERQLLEQLEDLVIGRIKDDLQRQIAAEIEKTERANEELKRRLETETNLTKAARQAINDIIILNNNNLQEKLVELNNKAIEDEIKKEIEKEQKIAEAKIILAEDGSRQELELNIAKLELKKQNELNSTELTNVERLAIVEKYEQLESDLKNKFLTARNERLTESINNEYQLKILQLQNTFAAESEILQAEYDRELEQNTRLKNLDKDSKAALYQNQIEYEIAVEESNKRLIESQNNLTNNQLRNAEAQANAFLTVGNAMSDLISAFNEDSAASIEFARTIALAEIAIKTAVAVAGAIASAQDLPYPANLAAAASGVAAVLSGIASAKRVIDQANKKQQPPESKVKKLATGGLVLGQGTGTSDSIPALLSNGESVINANSTTLFKPLLSALNQIGGGVGFGTQQVNTQMQGEDSLARSFAKGVAMLPAPVVSVKEINKSQERIKVLENLT